MLYTCLVPIEKKSHSSASTFNLDKLFSLNLHIDLEENPPEIHTGKDRVQELLHLMDLRQKTKT